MTPKQNGNTSRRLDAYVRVSRVAGREGDSFISVKVQEERIRAWAQASDGKWTAPSKTRRVPSPSLGQRLDEPG